MGVWALIATLAVALKLFTYEFHLPDDPTGGVALRSSPGWVSRQLLQPGDGVVLSDENEFVGAGLYRAAVNWGYLGVLAVGPLLLLRMRRGSAGHRV
jgi:hypothetical protein